MTEQQNKEIAVAILQLMKDKNPNMNTQEALYILRETERVMANAAILTVPTIEEASTA